MYTTVQKFGVYKIWNVFEMQYNKQPNSQTQMRNTLLLTSLISFFFKACI